MAFKIFLAIFGGALLTVFAAGLSAFLLTRGFLRESVAISQWNTARQTMGEIDHLLWNASNDITGIAGEYSFAEFLSELEKDPAKAHEMRRSLIKRLKAQSVITGPWDVLFIVDRHGRVVLSAYEPLLGDAIKSYPKKVLAFHQALRGRTYHSDAEVSRDTGKPTVIFGAPIRDGRDPANPILGAVIGNFSWPAIVEILSQARLPALLLNRSGFVIGDNQSLSRTGSFFEKTADRTSFGRTLPMQPISGGVFDEKMLTSTTVQTGHLSYKGNGWKLVLNNPERIAFGPATRSALKLVLILIPWILLMALMTLFVVRRLVVRPINELTRVTRAIAGGNLEKQAPTSSKDEIGLLGVSFNQMTARLRGFYRDLEKQVAGRTAELSKTNRELADELKNRAKTQEQADLLQTVTKAAVEARDFGSALEAVIRLVCQKTGWVIGQAWTPRQDGTALEFNSAWFDGDPNLAKFKTHSEKFTFEAGVGLPGRVWASKKPAWVRNVTDDPNFPRAPFAQEARLKNGFGIPILAVDEVIAVIEFFMLVPRAKDEELAGVISAVAAQLGSVIGRKRAQDALAAEKERLAVTLKSIGDAVITTDVFGRITLINAPAEHLTGWRQEEAEGRPLTEVFCIVHEETRQPCENPVEKVLQTQSVITLANHTALISRDGKERIIEDSGAPIRDSEGRVIGVVLVFRDVTGRKKIEAQILQSQKMETVGSLASGIAHDLNNQLTPIRGYMDLLLSQIAPGDPIRPMVQESNQAAIRCAEMIDRLVNFTKPSTQRLSLLDLNRTLNEFKTLLANFMPSTIRIEHGTEPGLRPIQGNETDLHTVLLNLAVNARDAMPRGGLLTIEAKNTVLHEDDPKKGTRWGSYVVISVRDTGVGMPSEIISRIFEPFFTTKEKTKGAGLGLAMVFNIVKNHGGWIDVSSAPGVGTVVQIYLPADTGAAPDAEEERKPQAMLPRGTETVLFVDDEETIRKLGKVFLERLGYRVILASDGKEAATIYQGRKNEIDLLVLDMTMPNWTGRQGVEKILEINPAAKIILASGYSSEGNAEELPALGAKGFIQKPFTIVPFAQLVRKVLDRQGP